MDGIFGLHVVLYAGLPMFRGSTIWRFGTHRSTRGPRLQGLPKHVAYVVNPSIAYAVIELSVWAAGAACVPLSVHSPQPELEYFVEERCAGRGGGFIWSPFRKSACANFGDVGPSIFLQHGAQIRLYRRSLAEFGPTLSEFGIGLNPSEIRHIRPHCCTSWAQALPQVCDSCVCELFGINQRLGPILTFVGPNLASFGQVGWPISTDAGPNSTNLAHNRSDLG